MNQRYASEQPERSAIDALSGAAVVSFGTDWCGYCRAAQSKIDGAFVKHPQVRHIEVEDGRGRPLGRSFKVKLWPTLIFLRDGDEVARVVRPTSQQAIEDALDQIDPAT